MKYLIDCNGRFWQLAHIASLKFLCYRSLFVSLRLEHSNVNVSHLCGSGFDPSWCRWHFLLREISGPSDSKYQSRWTRLTMCAGAFLNFTRQPRPWKDLLKCHLKYFRFSVGISSKIVPNFLGKFFPFLWDFFPNFCGKFFRIFVGNWLFLSKISSRFIISVNSFSYSKSTFPNNPYFF